MVKKYSVGIFLTIILLVFYLTFFPYLIQFFSNLYQDPTSFLFISRILLWGILFIVIFYNRIFEKENFLLWNEKRYNLKFTIKWSLIVYFVAVLSAGILNFIINLITYEGISERISEFSTAFKNSYLLLVFTCITAAITEEFLMRGYIQPRLSKIYSNHWVGIIGTSVRFGALHSTYGTLGQIMGTFTMGIVFSYFYYRFRSIKVLIIVHFMIDFISLNINQLAKY